MLDFFSFLGYYFYIKYMGVFVMDISFVVERLSSSEWVVVCEPYGLPVKTFSSFDAAEAYALQMRAESDSFFPFFPF